MPQETLRLEFAHGKELAAALRDLPRAVRGEILVAALVDGAAPIRDAAGALVRHRGPRRRPETVPLADSIQTFPGKRDALHAVVEVGTKKPTAHLVEFGHRMVVGGKLGSGGRVVGQVPAYPFLRPAADENMEATVQIIGESLGHEIEDAFAKRAPHEGS